MESKRDAKQKDAVIKIISEALADWDLNVSPMILSYAQDPGCKCPDTINFQMSHISSDKHISTHKRKDIIRHVHERDRTYFGGQEEHNVLH